MSDKPLVSVLMPVYNGECYLHKAVDSILTQTLSNFEFIIVEDGSTDSTWEILNSYHDPRIRLIRNEVNIGLARSFNRGLEVARGEYIARMDADDLSFLDRLAIQVDYLEAHPQVGVLGSNVEIIDGCGEVLEILRVPSEDGALRWTLCFYNPIVHPSVMIRRELVNKVGGYNENSLSCDYDLWCRLSDLTRLANLQDVLLSLRKHDMNFTVVRSTEVLNDSVRVSQLMISKVLNVEVPIGLVRYLRSSERTDSQEARQATELIYRLYQTVVTEYVLANAEKLLIIKDVVGRLFAMVWQRTATDDAYCAAKPIYKVSQNVRTDPALSGAEKKLVYLDAADKLYALASEQKCNFLHMWTTFIWACWLDPFLVGKAVKALLRRVTDNRG